MCPVGICHNSWWNSLRPPACRDWADVSIHITAGPSQLSHGIFIGIIQNTKVGDKSRRKLILMIGINDWK